MSAPKIIGSQSLNWDSFMDLATTTEAARALDAIYGEGAARAAIGAALEAALDGRRRDMAFFRRVAAKLEPRRLH